jgi:DNA-binding HxlR family transcriptional regulator
MSKKIHIEKRRSVCPIASALDIIGDKWSLLIIRDIGLFNKHIYKDFQSAEEKFPSNILAHRLKMLVENDIIEKRQYQDNPPRYEYHLTEKGRDLIPVIRQMAKWASCHVQGTTLPKNQRVGR